MALWDYPSNFSNGTQVDSMANLVKYGDYVTGYWFAYGWLALIWLFSFTVSMMMGAKRALLASSFVTFIFSIYFLRLGMVNLITVFGLVFLMIIGAMGSKEETI